MTYVGTFSTLGGQRLIRVDVGMEGLHAIATYTLTFPDGEQQRERSALGPDVSGVGLPFVAVIEMMRDLIFSGQGDDVVLVQPSESFCDEGLAMVIDCASAAHAINRLATSAVVQ